MHYTVFILRAQPAHSGHLSVIRTALKKSDRLILLFGTRNGCRSLKNPFTTAERIEIVKSLLTDNEIKRIHFKEVYDTMYNNNVWVRDVQQIVNTTILDDGELPVMSNISLIGHSKDSSSFYLKLFPEWNSIEVQNFNGLNATDMREELYRGNLQANWRDFSEKYGVVGNYRHTLTSLIQTEAFENLRNEYRFILNYKKEWGDGQWNTVDSVVTIGGHILLIQRGGYPGKDSWALPGGFLNEDERIVDAAVRELREETKLTVPGPVLYGSIDAHDVYDVPDRDPRGRIITHAYHFNMVNYGSFEKGEIKLPKIKGSDDAKKAQWFTLHEMDDMRMNMFADHYDIAKDLIGRASRKWN